MRYREPTSAQCPALVTGLDVRQMYLSGKPQLPDQDGILYLPQKGRNFYDTWIFIYTLLFHLKFPFLGGVAEYNFLFFFVNLTPSLRLLPILASALAIILLCRVLFRCLTPCLDYLRHPFYVSLFLCLFD